jgi:hypothetical protein
VPVIGISDFIATGQIRFNEYERDELILFIDKYSKQALVETLGGSLYQQFVDNLANGFPQNPDYLPLFNPIILDSCYCGCMSKKHNDGMREALINYVTFFFERSRLKRSTSSGKKSVNSENSGSNILLYSDLITIYNDSIESLRVIQNKAKELSLITECVHCPQFMLNF